MGNSGGAETYDGDGDIIRLGGGTDVFANAGQDSPYHFIHCLAGASFEEGEKSGIAKQSAQGIARLSNPVGSGHNQVPGVNICVIYRELHVWEEPNRKIGGLEVNTPP
jgi:hypothetical protein